MSNIFEELNREKKQLSDRAIRLEANLEHKIQQQTQAKQQAIELFGTDDPVELEKIVFQGQAKNQALEERIRKTNDVASQALSLLESGNDVPQMLIGQLEDLLSQDSTPSATQIAATKSVVKEESKVKDEEIIEPSFIDEDMGALEKAISTLPDDTPKVNPLDVLVDNAKSATSTHKEEPMFDEADELGPDEIGMDLDVSQVGSMENILADKLDKQPATQMKPSTLSF
jgi:hypothetical protein